MILPVISSKYMNYIRKNDMIKNFYNAPKSTVLGILVFISLSAMKIAGKLENEAYIPLATIAVTAMISDPFKEKVTAE